MRSTCARRCAAGAARPKSGRSWRAPWPPSRPATRWPSGSTPWTGGCTPSAAEAPRVLPGVVRRSYRFFGRAVVVETDAPAVAEVLDAVYERQRLVEVPPGEPVVLLRVT